MIDEHSDSGKLSDDQLRELDQAVVDNRKLHGIRVIREWTGASHTEALETYYHRYIELRRTSPTRFLDPHEDYWDGFYS